MRKGLFLRVIGSIVLLTQIVSCQFFDNDRVMSEGDKENCIITMKTHLKAISERDIETLKTTLPEGMFHLILPGRETATKSADFLKFHEEWFKDTTWTFETKIMHTDITRDMGIAIVEIIYKEPDREGAPYFNRMTVSYALKRINGNWYVIKDHASSIEKSQI